MLLHPGQAQPAVPPPPVSAPSPRLADPPPRPVPSRPVPPFPGRAAARRPLCPERGEARSTPLTERKEEEGKKEKKKKVMNENKGFSFFSPSSSSPPPPPFLLQGEGRGRGRRCLRRADFPAFKAAAPGHCSAGDSPPPPPPIGGCRLDTPTSARRRSRLREGVWVFVGFGGFFWTLCSFYRRPRSSLPARNGRPPSSYHTAPPPPPVCQTAPLPPDTPSASAGLSRGSAIPAVLR